MAVRGRGWGVSLTMPCGYNSSEYGWRAQRALWREDVQTDELGIKVVDFFCGIGGLTHGLIRAGLNVVAGIDSDKSCQFAYEANNKGATFIHRGIEEFSARELKALFKGAKWRVLVGCAPCQPFSTYTAKTRQAKKHSEDWNLISHFLKKIEDTRPDVVSMENVPLVTSQDIFYEFLEKLDKMRYEVSSEIINCADYSVPQSRRRLVLLASKHKEIKLPPPTRPWKTLNDAIRKVPRLRHGQQSSTDPLHRSSALREINLRRIRASRPGGTWDDWPKDLLPDCYKRDAGQTYKSVYGRMSWNKPAPTITGQFYIYGTGRFGHPKQDRALSLREGALIQSFPNNYQFAPENEKICTRTTARHIGNAVPVHLGQVIGETIIHHIKGI